MADEQYKTRTVCFGFLTPTEIKEGDDTIYIQKRQKISRQQPSQTKSGADESNQYSGEAVSGTDFSIMIRYAAISVGDNQRRKANTEELRLSYDDFVKMIIRENKVSKLESKFHGDAEIEEVKFREFVRSSNP